MALYLTLAPGDPQWSPRDKPTVLAMPPGSFILRENILRGNLGRWEAFLTSSLLGPEIVLTLPDPAPFPFHWTAQAFTMP
jgi:hypothetical protein